MMPESLWGKMLYCIIVTIIFDLPTISILENKHAFRGIYLKKIVLNFPDQLLGRICSVTLS